MALLYNSKWRCMCVCVHYLSVPRGAVTRPDQAAVDGVLMNEPGRSTELLGRHQVAIGKSVALTLISVPAGLKVCRLEWKRADEGS